MRNIKISVAILESLYDKFDRANNSCEFEFLLANISPELASQTPTLRCLCARLSCLLHNAVGDTLLGTMVNIYFIQALVRFHGSFQNGAMRCGRQIIGKWPARPAATWNGRLVDRQRGMAASLIGNMEWPAPLDDRQREMDHLAERHAERMKERYVVARCVHNSVLKDAG